jgi:hypothetical protein
MQWAIVKVHTHVPAAQMFNFFNTNTITSSKDLATNLTPLGDLKSANKCPKDHNMQAVWGSKA